MLFWTLQLTKVNPPWYPSSAHFSDGTPTSQGTQFVFRHTPLCCCPSPHGFPPEKPSEVGQHDFHFAAE